VSTHRATARYAAARPPEDALVAEHAGLVARCARRLAARTAGAVAADDLWSAGALGLLDAAKRFDAGRDVKFESFAEHRIRGAMLDELRRLDHLPRRLRADLDAAERARARLGQALGREPEAAEVAAELGVSLEDLDAMQALGAPHVDLSGVLDLECLEPGGEERAIRAELARRLAAAVGALPERLQLVLSLHYVEGLTYREIAGILKVSEPRVCQLHGEAMKLLRPRLAEDVD
jgi:RNA polymerase sigma factor for flagellar operon FliA